MKTVMHATLQLQWTSQGRGIRIVPSHAVLGSEMTQILRVWALILATMAWLALSLWTQGAETSGTVPLKELKAKATHGDADAQYLLGRFHEFGIGVAQDPVRAASCYRKAAEQNLVKAQYSLGRLYAEGQGVPQDPAQAVQWYRKAAAQNYALAKNKLGRMYATGQGVPQNDVEAYRWFTLAARHPNTSYALINRDALAKRMDAEQVFWGELVASESLATSTSAEPQH